MRLSTVKIPTHKNQTPVPSLSFVDTSLSLLLQLDHQLIKKQHLKGAFTFYNFFFVYCVTYF